MERCGLPGLLRSSIYATGRGRTLKRTCARACCARACCARACCALALPRVTISCSHWLVLQLLDRLDDLLDVTRRDLHLLQGVLEHGEILGIKVGEVIDVLILVACCLETIAMLCSSLRGPRKDP